MKIVLTLEQERTLLAWAGENTRADVDADVEPSGYRLVVHVSPPFDTEAEAYWGTRCLSLGSVEIELDGTGQADDR